ncbi:MAG: hypothetical protein ACOC56_03000 [Atribacterota bacterium]
MTPKELINYEYEILKHEIEKGCTESRLCDEFLNHPEYEDKLIIEAKYHFSQQKIVSDCSLDSYCGICWEGYLPRLRWHGNDGGYLI